jgi:hypothetical protein
MTSTRAHRRAAAVLVLALASGTAGTATAKPIDLYSGGSKPPAPYVAYPIPTTTPHPTSAGFDWAYLAIGGGAIGLALVGIGGTMAASQRRDRKQAQSRTTIAA